MQHYVCIHGHFYQPPRENPWLEEIQQQNSAAPYHDWNQKITAECYAPNTAARIVDSNQEIIDIVNNYSRISFDFAPTLLSWLKKENKEIYNAIIDADRKSQQLFGGHGSAIAHGYNHMILPLANSKDKKTQVIWGIEDFKSHFGRDPEGIWLPETAVDDETLEFIAAENIQFIILSPFQAFKVKMLEKGIWQNVEGGKINTQFPYLYRLPSGKTLTIFFYDGGISHDLAFSHLLENGQEFAKRLIGSFPKEKKEPRIVNIAVDGETFGHHKKFADMALASCLKAIPQYPDVDICNYGYFLEKNSPKHEVTILQNSAWSCSHGVGRWSKDCGCCTEYKPKWNQKWREPLRLAMDYLRDQLAKIFTEKLSAFVKDPWEIRNRYISLVLDPSSENHKRFFSSYFPPTLSDEEKSLIKQLLEMQRMGMLMYTSCGWFFDDISGIESIQILSYAARALQLAKRFSNDPLEEKFLSILLKAKSNIEKWKDGREIYRQKVIPEILELHHIARDFLIFSFFEKKIESCTVYSYQIETPSYEKIEKGDNQLFFGEVIVKSNTTLEKKSFHFISLQKSAKHIIVGMAEKVDLEQFSHLLEKVKTAFFEGHIDEIIDEMKEILTVHHLSFWDLFPEDQRKILQNLLSSVIGEITDDLENIHELNYPILKTMKDHNLLIPDMLIKSLDLILNTRLIKVLEEKKKNLIKLKDVVDKILEWSFHIDQPRVTYLATSTIEEMMESFSKDIHNMDILKKLEEFFMIMSPLSLPWNLWKSQNTYFHLMKYWIPEKEGNEEFMGLFKVIGAYLGVKV